MTSLQVLSDIHSEFTSQCPIEDVEEHAASFIPSVSIDYLVIAGDLGVASQLDRMEIYLHVWSKAYPRILYIAGNHEYYHSSLKKFGYLAKRLEKKYAPILSVIESGRSFPLPNGRQIHACTLWFVSRPLNYNYYSLMSDSIVIEDNLCTLEQRGLDDVCYLKNCVREGDIVITHHLPHELSVIDKFKPSRINRFFVNYDSHRIITENKPSLWIHGHAHSFLDYWIGKTRVVCNPWGYPSEERTNFVRHLILETD